MQLGRLQLIELFLREALPDDPPELFADRLLDPAERIRVGARLEPDETIVWLGRPVPTMRFKDWAGKVFPGVAIGLLVGLFLWQVVVPIWTGAGGGMRFGGETATDWAKKGIGAKVGVTLFALPFVAAVVGLVGSPLWHRMLESRRLYLVTNRRAHRIGRFLSKTWRPDEFDEFGRENFRGGLVNLFFATTREYSKEVDPRGRIVPDGFFHLRPADADAAENALRSLAKSDHAETAE